MKFKVHTVKNKLLFHFKPVIIIFFDLKPDQKFNGLRHQNDVFTFQCQQEQYQIMLKSKQLIRKFQSIKNSAEGKYFHHITFVVMHSCHMTFKHKIYYKLTT